jgi:hypothetical protein
MGLSFSLVPDAQRVMHCLFAVALIQQATRDARYES